MPNTSNFRSTHDNLVSCSDHDVSQSTTDPVEVDLTHILLLALSHIPPYSPWLIGLTHRPRLIMAFQSYLSHPDPSIRRLGMLVAEILSELTIRSTEAPGEPTRFQSNDIDELRAGLEVDEEANESPKPAKKSDLKRLRFAGMWDGHGEGKDEARWLRSAVGVIHGDASLDEDDTGESWLLGWTGRAIPQEKSLVQAPIYTTALPRGRPAQPQTKHQKSKSKPKPKPKIVMLSEDQLADPLQGYASASPSSSRSPSPTPSYLEEVAADPSLALDASSRTKIARPVYIPQLIALLKEREKPECIEMALKWGEGLVRAKREFGTELGEQAHDPV